MRATKPSGRAIEMPVGTRARSSGSSLRSTVELQVGTGVAGVGVGRQRQVGVEAHDRDVEVGVGGRSVAGTGRTRAVNLPAGGGTA